MELNKLKINYKSFLLGSLLFVVLSTFSWAEVVSKSNKTSCGSIEISIDYESDTRDFTGYRVELDVSSLKLNKPSYVKIPFSGVYFRSKCLTNPKGRKYFVFQAYCIGSAKSCTSAGNYGIIETYFPKVRLVPSPNNKELAEKIFMGSLPYLRNEEDAFYTK